MGPASAGKIRAAGPQAVVIARRNEHICWGGCAEDIDKKRRSVIPRGFVVEQIARDQDDVGLDFTGQSARSGQGGANIVSQSRFFLGPKIEGSAEAAVEMYVGKLDESHCDIKKAADHAAAA